MATAKMEALTAFEIDVITGVETIRELTPDEITQLQQDDLAAKATKAEAEAKAAARESALAKLADLGLTAEEIAAL
jgi:hypothetical protein